MKYLILIMLSFLAACTGKKLIVQNADSLISYQITKRVPLYSDQKNSLAKDLDQFLNSHKKTAVALMPLLDTIQSPSVDIEKTYGTLETEYRQIVNDFSRLLARHISPLDSKQQKDFLRNLEEENRKISQKTTAERMDEISERFVKFFGSITKEQRAIFSSYNVYYTESMGLRLKRREALHQTFKDIYASDASAKAKEDLIYSAFLKYQDDLFATTKSLEIVKKVSPTLTPAQKDTMKKKVEEIKEILNYYVQVEF